MTNKIDEWFNDKKKTYWKTWECNDTDHPPGTWSWVLFFTGADLDATYHYGISGSEAAARVDIKEAIGIHLHNKSML